MLLEWIISSLQSPGIRLRCWSKLLRERDYREIPETWRQTTPGFLYGTDSVPWMLHELHDISWLHWPHPFLVFLCPKETLPDVGLHHSGVALNGSCKAPLDTTSPWHHGPQYGRTWCTGGSTVGKHRYQISAVWRLKVLYFEFVIWRYLTNTYTNQVNFTWFTWMTGNILVMCQCLCPRCTFLRRYPELYRSVSAFSPIVHPTESPWGQKAFNLYLGSVKLCIFATQTSDCKTVHKVS